MSDLFGSHPALCPGEAELIAFGEQFEPASVPRLPAGPYSDAFKAQACRALWREVIWQCVLDLVEGWDVSPQDAAETRAWFRGATPDLARDRAMVCALADIDESTLVARYRSGTLFRIAAGAIGRERWQTRRDNIAKREATTPGTQIPLFDRDTIRRLEQARDRLGLGFDPPAKAR